jgi:hypothetical protein
VAMLALPFLLDRHHFHGSATNNSSDHWHERLHSSLSRH